MPDLRADLQRLDGKPYPAYRDLRRRPYEVGEISLCLEHVQGDPFASPSRLRIDVAADVAALPSFATAHRDARRATADFLQRALRRALPPSRGGARADSGKSGRSGKSGMIEIAGLGQEILERTGVVVGEDGALVIRPSVGLPAAGRRILGGAAAELLAAQVPAIVRTTLGEVGDARLAAHVRAVEDQVALRDQLEGAGLVAFVADGSVLPRRSGADDRPLAGAVPFAAPASMRIELATPHAGRVGGMAVASGVSLIVGGGYHGKSTLLQALARGVYDHVPGDGRERCVTRDGAVCARAEDGRSVCGVDLRPFIGTLPGGRSTRSFATQDASGSTSQAAAIVEAIEVGATALLIDEDTAATNFMIRDTRMRALIAAAAEPITLFLDRVRQLHDELGVSSVLVVGGAGDYLDVADAVVQMHDYTAVDVSEAARRVAAELPLGAAAPRRPDEWVASTPRRPLAESFDARRGRRQRVRGVRTRSIELGEQEIDVSLLPQLVDPAQCRMIGDVLLLCGRDLCDGRRSVAEVVAVVDQRIATEGLAAVAAATFGDRAAARRFEIAAAINRLRSLRLA